MNDHRKLNICFLTHGSMRHTVPYCRFFAKRGHNVSCITFTPPTVDFGVPVHDISNPLQQSVPSFKWLYLTTVIKLKKLLKADKPDILHGHYVTSAGVLCMLAGFRPYILSIRGSDLVVSMNSAVWRRILRRVFRQAAVINPVSHPLAELTAKLGVPSEKILVATQGIDLQRFNYGPPRPLVSPVRLLCTRVLGDLYNPIAIIDACSILTDRNVPFKLTFAAGGPLQRRLEKLVSDKGLAKQVTFSGGYEHSTLPQLLHGHDIYVSASFWDGTSISLLEAMAAGIFPVVSRIRSNQAWVEDGKTALMFDAENPRELADGIGRIIENQALRTNAVQMNRRRVEQEADHEKNMLLLEERYYQIVHSSRAE